MCVVLLVRGLVSREKVGEAVHGMLYGEGAVCGGGWQVQMGNGWPVFAGSTMVVFSLIVCCVLCVFFRGWRREGNGFRYRFGS